jgi:NADPH:quinone reductase-like Zn-dependent oxidoreductase
MKAVIYTKYGSPDVLQHTKVAQPTPGDYEVLIKVHAASVNAADWHLLRGAPFVARLSSGLFRPNHPILGADVAGRVEAVGRSATRFRPGDEVFGDLSAGRLGAFAEYVCAREDALTLKPTAISFEEAAATPMAAVTALQGLRSKGRIRTGQRVLINGASGGVGTFAVQIAKALGAEVTAVCSTRNLDAARALGADHVIDYTREDFTRNGQRYDLIAAVNGFHSLSDYRRALSPQGSYVMIGGSNAQIFQALLLASFFSRAGGQQMGHLMAKPNGDDLDFVKGLLESGKIRPVIDRCYPLHGVADAIRYVEAGHAQGKVVIVVA